MSFLCHLRHKSGSAGYTLNDNLLIFQYTYLACASVSTSVHIAVRGFPLTRTSPLLDLLSVPWAVAYYNTGFCHHLLCPVWSKEERKEKNKQLKLRKKIRYIISAIYEKRPPLWSSGQSSWLQIQRSWVLFPALPDHLRSSGSGTGSTQPREDN
jgi:hypothetical protein